MSDLLYFTILAFIISILLLALAYSILKADVRTLEEENALLLKNQLRLDNKFGRFTKLYNRNVDLTTELLDSNRRWICCAEKYLIDQISSTRDADLFLKAFRDFEEFVEKKRKEKRKYLNAGQYLHGKLWEEEEK